MRVRDDDELSTRARGFAVEARVAVHLGARGLAVLATNVTIAGAELDLVARCEEPEPTIVFVEVRSRRDADRGHAVETIDAEKRRRIVRGATAWLVAHDLWGARRGALRCRHRDGPGRRGRVHRVVGRRVRGPVEPTTEKAVGVAHRRPFVRCQGGVRATAGRSSRRASRPCRGWCSNPAACCWRTRPGCP
ncbi:MAG: YraN family protein [Deltaproteobacteria bacterium]|nr:YraN family protein [Deltaproteobacteria bacterium]